MKKVIIKRKSKNKKQTFSAVSAENLCLNIQKKEFFFLFHYFNIATKESFEGKRIFFSSSIKFKILKKKKN